VRFVLVVGTTETAQIPGLTAAGETPEATAQTPALDAELVEFGRPLSGATPASPDGCPTPALVTRAVRELVGFETFVIDAGLASETVAPTRPVGGQPGRDIREAEPVPDAITVFERSREVGRKLPDDELVVGESIPGGTTTALGVLAALGEPYHVSSSLPENPLALKERVVTDGLAASALETGDAAGEPCRTVRLMGDPVLASVAGLTVGALESRTTVTLAGGTQLVAAAALVRHAGVDRPLALATTPFVAEDDAANIESACADLDLSLTVTDPGFGEEPHPAFEAYTAGVAKEGVGMGGALALAAADAVSMRAVRARISRRYRELLGPVDGTERAVDDATVASDRGRGVFDATLRAGVLQLRRERTRWLSTGSGGGFSRADAAYNVEVPDGWEETDLERYGERRRRQSGFDGDGPTLFTGVSMAHVRGARAGPVEVYATAGLSNPAALPVGDDAVDGSTDRSHDESAEPGTVNLLVGTTRALDDAALANLATVAAEAKAATLLSTTAFTGTTSDAVVVGCDPDGEPSAFSGSATAVGAAARVCVRDAILASLQSRYPDGGFPSSVEAADYGVVTDGESEVFGPAEF